MSEIQRDLFIQARMDGVYELHDGMRNPSALGRVPYATAGRPIHVLNRTLRSLDFTMAHDFFEPYRG